MEKLYYPNDIEYSVQQYWHKHQTFVVKEDYNKQKYYCLSMLPYPSGNLHMGHVRNYTIGDVISRYQRMLGKNVLQPIGWDAFGLPAEQAAIIHQKNPANWTYSNINYMRDQLKSLGFAYDWNRELITCQPQYYRWEQWFFTILYKKGLIYRKTSVINWCPYHNTVLANEQVVNNCCWRCNTPVQYKKIPQWFIKITAYADQLLNGLDQLTNWPETVKIMQRNWIGRSEGIDVIFKIINYDATITIFITELHIFMDITYLMISVDHPITLKLAEINPELNHFINKYNKIFTTTYKDNCFNYKKNGIFTNFYAMHPLNHNKLPIWIVNFSMFSEIFEIGAIAGCPMHNQKDLVFAHKYNIPIQPVTRCLNECFFDENLDISTLNQFIKNQFNNLNNMYISVISQTISKILVKHELGKPKVYYRLKDWCISRQRYWGTPIPMIILNNKVFQTVPEDQLPVILPENVNINTNTHNILKTCLHWVQTIYKNQSALRDTDTFDTFIESSWYYARYTCPNYHDGMLDSNIANYWLPIDQYIGGIEHAIMHLLYFRFFHKLMRDVGLVNSDEPATRLLCQGMILSDAFYYTSKTGEKVWVSPDNVLIKHNKNGYIKEAIDKFGNKLIYAGMCKMSKSKNNGVNPNTMIQKYGADAVRLFIMFAAPAHAALEWKISGIEGANRFLRRLWDITYQHIQKKPISNNIIQTKDLNSDQKLMRRNVHQTIVKVTDDIDRRQSFNTAIAAIMKLVKNIYHMPKTSIQDQSILQEALLVTIRLLYPFTPHISFVLWKALGNKENIDDTSWPKADIQIIKNEKVTVAIQINGKMKQKISVPINSDQDTICKIIMKRNISIQNNCLINQKIKKIIFIPNKIINFLVQ